MNLVLTAVGGYLLGSIPFGYILVKAFRGQDIRETGSGNIGATNVSRTSPLLGVATLTLDMLKGFAAVAIARAVFPSQPKLAALAAVCAVVGHIFPVWLKLRGGKGVATGIGSFILLAPKAVVIAVGVFAVVVLAFRYVSLASIMAMGALPVVACAMGKPSWLVGSSAAASLLIIAKHHENIRRLLGHTESRFQLRRS